MKKILATYRNRAEVRAAVLAFVLYLSPVLLYKFLKRRKRRGK
jgi:hypothetical protein